MASAAQIAANRANAKLSTGPVTPEGKAKVATNRLSHGLTGLFRLLDNEKQADYDALLDALAQEYEPKTVTDIYYLNQAAENMVRQQRASELEQCALTLDLQPPVQQLDVIIRYTNSARRAVERALKHLIAAKKERQAIEKQPLVEIGFESQKPANRLPDTARKEPAPIDIPVPRAAAASTD